jgi:RNA polymerase sigma-70 factor, ECF subfamily
MDPDLLHAVLRFREGRRDEAAEGVLDRLLRPRLRLYFAHGPWPPDEAEDLVQGTLARVYTHVDQLHEPERFYGWLFAIARNVRRTAWAEWEARRRVELPPVETGAGEAVALDAGGEHAAIAGERAIAVARAIGELPSRQRECLLLRVREEMSYEEIAETLRLSPVTVRNHIAQAKESLRRLILDPKETRR